MSQAAPAGRVCSSMSKGASSEVRSAPPLIGSLGELRWQVPRREVHEVDGAPGSGTSGDDVVARGRGIRREVALAGGVDVGPAVGRIVVGEVEIVSSAGQVVADVVGEEDARRVAPDAADSLEAGHRAAAGVRHGVVEDLDLPKPREGSGIEVHAVAARRVDDVVRQEQVGVGRLVDVDAVPPDVVNEVVADGELVAHRWRAEDDAVGGGAAAPLDLQPLEGDVVVEEEDGPEAVRPSRCRARPPFRAGRSDGLPRPRSG